MPVNWNGYENTPPSLVLSKRAAFTTLTMHDLSEASDRLETLNERVLDQIRHVALAARTRHAPHERVDHRVIAIDQQAQRSTLALLRTTQGRSSSSAREDVRAAAYACPITYVAHTAALAVP